MIVAALSAAAAVLLAVAGVAKLRTPGPAAGMIAGFWPRLSRARARTAARSSGVVELGAGLAVLGFGGRGPAVALAVCFLVLTVVAIRLVRRPDAAPCGCFGAADADVGIGHVVLDACAMAIASVAIVRPSGGVSTLFDGGTLSGVMVCAQAVLLAALGYLSITALPALVAARRSLETP